MTRVVGPSRSPSRPARVFEMATIWGRTALAQSPEMGHCLSMPELSGPRSSTTVGELPLQPPVVLSEETSLSAVAGIFLRQGISCVLLREAPLRVVTERDL